MAGSAGAGALLVSRGSDPDNAWVPVGCPSRSDLGPPDDVDVAIANLEPTERQAGRNVAVGAGRGRRAESRPAGALHRAEDGALVAEAHLPLGGVHVDVDSCPRHLHDHDPVPVATSGNQPSVRLVDRGEQRSIVHEALVDDEHEAAARCPVRVR